MNPFTSKCTTVVVVPEPHNTWPPVMANLRVIWLIWWNWTMHLERPNITFCSWYLTWNLPCQGVIRWVWQVEYCCWLDFPLTHPWVQLAWNHTHLRSCWWWWHCWMPLCCHLVYLVGVPKNGKAHKNVLHWAPQLLRQALTSTMDGITTLLYKQLR